MEEVVLKWPLRNCTARFSLNSLPNEHTESCASWNTWSTKTWVGWWLADILQKAETLKTKKICRFGWGRYVSEWNSGNFWPVFCPSVLQLAQTRISHGKHHFHVGKVGLGRLGPQWNLHSELVREINDQKLPSPSLCSSEVQEKAEHGSVPACLGCWHLFFSELAWGWLWYTCISLRRGVGLSFLFYLPWSIWKFCICSNMKREKFMND